MSRFNQNFITKRRSYNFDDLRKLYKINHATLNRWLKKGLVPLERGVHPILVMGIDLIDFFVKTKTSELKGQLGSEGFLCKTCHAVVMGATGSIRIEKTGKKIGKNNDDQLIRKATCELCGGYLQRFWFVGDQDYTGVDSDERMPGIKVADHQIQITMRPRHKNEITKRKYFDYLRHAKERSAGTIAKHEQALWLWEDFSINTDFREFDEKKAMAFKDWLANKKKTSSDQLVSASYRYDVLRSLKSFFVWLLMQKGYRNISPDAVDYLSPSSSDSRIAHQPKPVKYPTLDDTRTLIEHITESTEVARRDKALISLLSLTGIRAGAVVTLQLRCFDKERLVIYQDPKLGVKTKFSKATTSFLIALGYPERITYFTDWCDHLKQRGFGPTDPIFPLGEVKNGIDNNVSFQATGRVTRKARTDTAAIRRMLGRRCDAAGIQRYHPHAFRHALAADIAKANLNEEEKKAFSQNFGHQNIQMTFGTSGYGRIPEDRQIEILKWFDVKRADSSNVARMHSGDFANLEREIKELKAIMKNSVLPKGQKKRKRKTHGKHQ